MRFAPLCVTLLGATLFLPFGCSEHQDAVPPPVQVTEKPAPAPPQQVASNPNSSGSAANTVPPVSVNEKSAAGMPAKSEPPMSKPAAPGGKGLTAEEALKQVPALDPKFAALQKTMESSEASLQKSPNDPKLKAAYVEATYNYGHQVTADGRAPQIMYRAALALYRRALKVDPKHQPSLDDKKTIEDIYTQMGRPIPQ